MYYFNYKMDLLNILIDPKKVTDLCCICYKSSNNMISLNDCIEVQDDYFDLNTTFRNIFKNLFPSHNLVLSQACEDCFTLILKLFNLFQKKYLKDEILSYMLENLNEEINEIECEMSYKKIKKCRLKINIHNEGILNNEKFIKNFQCDKCLMKFRSETILKKHALLAHNNLNEAVICDICGKIFNKNALLKSHLECHKEEQCPICLKYFKSHSHFNLHVKKHNTQIKIKKNVKHKKCNYCSYQSLSKATLEAHINKMHLKIRPYICELCQKSFYKKDHLNQHLLTHNKIKDKICHVCGDSFSLEKTLKEHLRLHSGLKPFICNICNIGFTTSSRRYEHIKRKHMEKNESCIICAKKFSLKKFLNTHLQTVHGSELKKD